jgi:hypothetical protein
MSSLIIDHRHQWGDRNDAMFASTSTVRNDSQEASGSAKKLSIHPAHVVGYVQRSVTHRYEQPVTAVRCVPRYFTPPTTTVTIPNA